MLLKFDYGNKKLRLDLNKKNIERIITSKRHGILEDPADKIKEKLNAPIASDSLPELLRKNEPEDILIIVNDISRPTPYRKILPPLLNKIHSLGYQKEDIRFLVATGVHDKHSLNENKEVLSENVAKNYEIISHNADKNNSFVKTLSTGNDLYINKIVLEADFIITTGVIKPHYLAGYSGGRKSLLPGVCGRNTINNNHKLMIDIFENNKNPAQLNDNPIHNEMLEAADLVKIDFIVNVLTNSDGEITDVIAGNWHEAWKKGVQKCKNKYHVPIQFPSDLTIASAGGYPRDINLYQAHKALEHAIRATKKGGTIILIAECSKGFGHETFEKWIKSADSYEQLKDKLEEKFILGGHKAFALANIARDYNLVLISSLSKKETKQAFFRKKETIKKALKEFKPLDANLRINILPAAAEVVPEIKT